MDFGLITSITGQPEFRHCKTKKAFLQQVSELIDECEAKGATLFDLLLNTDLDEEEA